MPATARPHNPMLLALVERLERTFAWDETPEGDEYWLGVYERLVRLLCPKCLERLKRHRHRPRAANREQASRWLTEESSP
jgi:hypothetical protein